MKTPHKKRIQVAVALLGEFARLLDTINRASAVELLKKAYEENALQPIRGKAQPADIYDKEMATLYVIGKYGLKLDQDYPALFEKVFHVEEILESALSSIIQGDFNSAREKLVKVSSSGTVDSNTIARLLRIPLTKLILGFQSEDNFKTIMRRVLEAFPVEEKTVRNYARFFIGLKLAEAIYRGEIRSREEKEALKKALAIRLGTPKSTPSDDYVKAIARSVFNIGEKIIERILSGRGREGESGGNTEKNEYAPYNQSS